MPAEAEEPLTCFITGSLEINQFLGAALKTAFVKCMLLKMKRFRLRTNQQILNHLPEYGIACRFEIQSRLIQEGADTSWKILHPIEINTFAPIGKKMIF